MLRLAIALLTAVIASAAAEAADRPLVPRITYPGWHRTFVLLPPGLPRSHYRFRTTISYGDRRPVPRLTVYEAPAILYAPDFADVPYIRPLPPYRGPTVPYWDRLPYACVAYGYC
jgi:hypothetical protein